MKREIDNSIAIVGVFNSLLSIMDRTTREKVNKETEGLKSTITPAGPDRHLQDTPSYNNSI